MRQIETEFFLQNMQINALASLLIAKHIKPLLAKAERSAEHPAILRPYQLVSVVSRTIS
ncbi:hypothetical protein [Psychrobacter sp. KH172YL61]|uniref:hypothetical protein n=1 Tax=Psychrobacter sp. KH172YL61 TaxID=2517899 RepID=UPI001F088512|nr:hypothetical protein [Psychrobacter sp. KH172YL61]